MRKQNKQNVTSTFTTMRFFCLLWLTGLTYKATAKDSNYVYGVNYLGGKILVHTKKIYSQAPDYSHCVEFSYQKKTSGSKAWQQRYGFPTIGLNIALLDYGSELLGYGFGFYPSLQTNLYSGKKNNVYVKIGGGIGFVTKRWQRTPAQDSLNNFVGSYINNFTMIQLAIQQQVSKKWLLHSGIHFNHLSNAAARQPNFGINMLGVFAGLSYHPNQVLLSPEKKTLAVVANTWHVGIRSAIAFAEDRTPDGPLYPHYNYSLFGIKKYKSKFAAQLGLDATFSTKTYAFIKNNYLFDGKERAHSWRYSVFVGNEFLMGKIGIPLQFGYYLNRPLGGDYVYQKLGINYHLYQKSGTGLINDIFLGTVLKTHLANAEYAELCLGFWF